MNDSDFLRAGYKEFSRGQLDSEGIETCFQKAYEDLLGRTAYFITVRKWKGFYHPYSGESFPPSYEYNVQLYKKDDHDAIDLLFHSSWDLHSVEDYMEKLWRTGLFDYYER